jgi:hypothetical protein
MCPDVCVLKTAISAFIVEAFCVSYSFQCVGCTPHMPLDAHGIVHHAQRMAFIGRSNFRTIYNYYYYYWS